MRRLGTATALAALALLLVSCVLRMRAADYFAERDKVLSAALSGAFPR